MDRVKKLEDIILTEWELLVEMVTETTKSGIITDVEGTNLSKDESSSYGIVVACGNAVKDIGVGDIIVKTKGDGTSKLPSFKYDEKSYSIMVRHLISIAVKPNNFIKTDEISA